MKYRTKWQNLIFFIFILGVFVGLSYIKGLDNWILWVILAFLILFNTAAIFDFFSSPVWVEIKSDKVAGTIKLTSRLRSCHMYMTEKHSCDLLDVVVKTNYLTTTDKDDVPQIVGHTIILVFKANEVIYFNINKGEYNQDWKNYIRQLDEFHFNGNADRCAEINKKQEFDYYKVANTFNFIFALVFNFIVFFLSDFLIRKDTKRPYSFMSD